MAVVVETTLGDFTIDLFVNSRPQACKNFLKLCKMKYYNFCLFHSVQPNFLAQTGDPTGLGNGGESIYGLLYGENARYFEAELMPKLKHSKPGLVSMVNCGNNMLGSQFFITLGEELVSLDQEHCIFGEITEGIEIVLRLNEAICDSLHRPYKDIRISHTVILDDPFEDPSGLIAPDMSPEPTQEKLANGRIGADEAVDEMAGLSAVQVEELKQEREARARATILEIVGDLPDAEMAPPENVLFVCKLNPVTTDDDLEIIFSRFGKVKSCEVIRDKNTGDSLQYAFVEFEDQKACEEAYFKMDNVLIDDRRIHVDFSQSVAKMRWRGKGRGVDYFDSKEQPKDDKSNTHRDRDDSKSKSSNRRDYEERERRRDRGRDRGRDDERPGREREDDRGREKVRDKEVDDRHRRRDDRDRSRSDWRKRDGKRDRKDDYRDDDKRYDSKRRDVEGSRRREDDSKKISSSSSKKVDEKRHDEKRLDERKREKESRDLNGRSSSRQSDFIKSESVEKPEFRGSTEILEVKKGRETKYSSPLLSISKEDTLSDNCLLNVEEELAKSPDPRISQQTNDSTTTEVKSSQVSRRSSKEDRKHDEETKKGDIENDMVEVTVSQNIERKTEEIKPLKDNKKITKRKRKVSDSKKKKKRRHSSSSESSSESSDSSDSSSSSDSSDYRHSKKKKLIVAKRYFRGGKLVKEIKKKKRTNDSSESESASEESSDSDSKRKRKTKKQKKVINIFKQPRKKTTHSSEESQSESSSSEDSDVKNKKKKKKVTDKQIKKKSKYVSSKKKKKRKEETTSSSDSDNSVKNKSVSKKQNKFAKNSKCETALVSTTSE